MKSRNQYLKALIDKRGYLLKSKKEKSKLLDEYCQTTGLNRNYVIRKIRSGAYLRENFGKRKRKEYYDGYVKEALVKIWRIFDYPCGQRLEAILKSEVERLRKMGELICSEEVAEKLKKIDSSTIDEKLKHQREIERIRKKHQRKVHPLLYQKIPVKVMEEQDRNESGNIQLDLIEHCGQSAFGEFINTLSTADILYGWWEGEAVMGRGQERTFKGIEKVRERHPIPFLGKASIQIMIPPSLTGTSFTIARKRIWDFQGLVPIERNNALVEQKNWTHVKKFVGCLRYDSEEELNILNDLYRNELRLYKNFFQPVMKLISKERIGGKIHRKYDFSENSLPENS